MLLSPDVRRFFEEANFGHLATVEPDGGAHVTPVWLDVDEDGRIVVNTAEGRRKLKNMRRDARVTISVVDQQNPYQTVTVIGRVVELRHDGADDHIDSLAKKYLGQDRYPFRAEGERRVIVVIEPERVLSSAA